MKKFFAIAAASAFGLASAAYAQNAMHGEGNQMHQSMPGADSRHMMPMDNMGDAAKTQTHSATGKVLSIKAGADKQSITLAHGPVSSLQWPSMTMTFRVASPELLTGVREGDAVAVHFVKGGGGSWVVTHLEKAGS